MATTIVQKPLYSNIVPVGQEVIFSISNNNVVAQFTNVSFQADVYISNGTPPTVTGTPLATFKTKPNNLGVGIFDFRQVVESYVAADNLAGEGSSYKTALTNTTTTYPLHLIDKYSTNRNAVRWLVIQFKTIYTDNSGIEQEDVCNTLDNWRLYNAYLKHEDVIKVQNVNFGYDASKFVPLDDTKQFLTNAPVTQYANLEDYGTFSFAETAGAIVNEITLTYYNSLGVQIGTEPVMRTVANGANYSTSTDVKFHLFYFGCFPANLRNWSTTFQALVPPNVDQMSGGRIEVQTKGVASNDIIKLYTINVNCPNLKGYESIRLCWLNQWGAWDYYTFTQKSVRSISTAGSTYQQLGGTWNANAYYLNGYKGGKKTFRVNATEKIVMNTDFVSESENVMFEELTNSPEVYILKGYSEVYDVQFTLNQYVAPVRVTSTSFTKKTVANDKLIQYTFEVEKSKTLRTQSV